MQPTPAEPKDIPQWLVLAAEVEPLFGPMTSDPAFLVALTRNIARHTAFCIRESGQPAGAPLLGGLLLSPHPPLYTIGWLAVSRHSRRQGIGRLLVTHVLSQARPPAEFIVTTFAADTPEALAARSFYESLGFTPAESAPNGPEGASRCIYRRQLHPL